MNHQEMEWTATLKGDFSTESTFQTIAAIWAVLEWQLSHLPWISTARAQFASDFTELEYLFSPVVKEYMFSAIIHEYR
jgi:hypothetical protein